MAAVNASVNTDNVSRGKSIKIINFIDETWSDSQQTKSSYRSLGTTTVSLKHANFDLFPKRKKRGFVEKAGGVVATPVQEQAYTRRALYVKTFHAATQADLGDLVDNQSDMLADAKVELMNDMGRITDTIILSALIGNSAESDDASTSGVRPNSDLTAQVNLSERVRLPFYHAKGKVTVAKAATSTTPAVVGKTEVKFDTDTIEDILYVFAIRDMMGDLCATLTPEVRRILRKDKDFKDADNIFAPMKRSVDDSREGFNYKGVNWITCSQSVLPIISQKNAGLTARGTLTLESDTALPSVDVGVDSGLGRTRSFAASAIDAADRGKIANRRSEAQVPNEETAGYTTDAYSDTELKTVTCKSKDVLYIWGKSAVYFAERPQENFAADAELPLFSHAKQGYVRINLGAMLIDDDHAIAVPVKGLIT